MQYLYILFILLFSLSTLAKEQPPLISLSNKIDDQHFNLSLAKQTKPLNQQRSLTIELPELGLKKYKRLRSYSTDKNKQIWLGQGDNHSSVSLIQSEFGLSGSIRTQNGTWLIRPTANGQSSLEKFDKSQFQQINDVLPRKKDITQLKQSRAVDLKKQKVASSAYNANFFQHIQTQAPAGFSDSNDIRILVYYSEQAIFTYPNLEDLIELDFADANQALINSNINASYTLAGLIRLADKKGDTNLYDMLDRRGNFTRMDEMRDKYDADLAHFYGWRLIDQAVCGVAFYSTDSTGWIDPRYAVGATSPSCMGTLTFAHEVGHNLGARHDRYAENGGTDDYAYGYVDLENEFQTLMSYTNKCTDNGKYCTEITHYSNPAVNYNEQATGVNSEQPQAADNGQLLNTVANVAANFNGVGYPENFQVSKGELSKQVALSWTTLNNSDGYQITRQELNGLVHYLKISIHGTAKHLILLKTVLLLKTSKQNNTVIGSEHIKTIPMVAKTIPRQP